MEGISSIALPHVLFALKQFHLSKFLPSEKHPCLEDFPKPLLHILNGTSVIARAVKWYLNVWHSLVLDQ